MHDNLRAPYIFIVYQDSEVDLANPLQELFKGWGYEAFHCRQQHRDAQDYRVDLREKLFKCDVVVLLLSREFRWSSYCQAEAGSTMVFDKPFVPIIVSPATVQEIDQEIAPVLAKYQCVSTDDPDFLNKVEASLRSALDDRKARLTQLLATLQGLGSKEPGPSKIVYDGKETIRRSDVAAAVKNIEEKYLLYQPKKAAVTAWPSLTDDGCKQSIVGNIRKSLEDRKKDTTLVFVGVSLKYSLKLIADALVDLSKNGKPTAAEASIPKKLRITLVHMDSESHILHAMKDQLDTESIRDNFDDAKWLEIYDHWKTLCKSVAIELEKPIRHRIDYIPPRVGLLIDATYLYAGRCSIRLIGDHEVPMTDVHSNLPPPPGNIPRFNLDVGENEYQFFIRDPSAKHDDTPTNRAIYKAMREFRGSVVAYRQRRFNAGIRSIWESAEWTDALDRYISARTPADTITFVSATSQRFHKLIRSALRVGASVTIYHHDVVPNSQAILSLRARYKPATVVAYDHSPTFRAVIVGDVAIGFQPYITPDLRSEGAEMTKLPLCLIITSLFSNFTELKQSVLESFEPVGQALA
jgi:TIR domain